MVSDDAAWEENDESGEAPSEAEILVSRGTNWAWCLIHDTGDPYTFRHFLHGCYPEGDGGPYGDECYSTSSF
jgi:hypothetical protein